MKEDSQKNGKFIVTQETVIDLNKPQIKVTFSDLITLQEASNFLTSS